MTNNDLYKEAKQLLLNMPPCVDGGYQFACTSCVATAVANWAERVYQQGREDVASEVNA